MNPTDSTEKEIEDELEISKFECGDCGETWEGKAANRCLACGCARVYLVTEVGDRVPV